MSNVDDLFERYRAAYGAGEDPDAWAYLAEVSGPDRAELDALITGFLATAPGRAYDAEAFDAFVAAPRVQQTLARVREGVRLDWTTVLPAARESAQIRRSDLVARLAERIGAKGKERKVGRYYHEMEIGKLTARDVSTKVLAALAEIVSVPVARLRATGIRPAPPPAGAPAPMFARAAKAAAPAAAEAAKAPPPDEWDEVDELFTGGPGD
jgi:hypothetical protein